MNRFQRSYNRSAFTLIELLVVIAIIAILAAILFPVFAQARAKARQTSCLSNMKQLGMGMMGYYQDYDEVGPITRDEKAPDQSGTKAWTLAIMPYVQKLTGDQYSIQGGNASIYNCPENPHSNCPDNQNRACSGYAITIADPPAPASNPMRDRFSEKCGKRWSCVPGMNSNAARGQTLADMPAPAELIMVAEHPGQWNQLGSGNGTYVNSPVRSAGSWGYSQLDNWEPSPGDGKTTKKALHNEGWNYSFADGHVKWHRPEATIGAAKGGTMGNPFGYWTLDPED